MFKTVTLEYIYRVYAKGYVKYNYSLFFMLQLPCGLPPVLPSIGDELERFLTCPEKLPVHDFKKAQRYISLFQIVKTSLLVRTRIIS